MLFSYKIFKVSWLFSQHPNKFHCRKFQNHNHNHKFFKVSWLFSQRHYHTTTTTTKIKITKRDWWVEGEIERRGAISVVLDRRLVRGWIGVWFAELFLSLALSLSFGSVSSFFLLHVEGNGLKVKWIYKTIFRSNEQNFGQTEIIFQKFYFP